MEEKSKILLIYTGGTIGMVQDPDTGLFKPFDFDHLMNHIPELKNIWVDISSISFDKPMDSSNIGLSVWVKLVKLIEKNYDDFDGFVILHGSDTMAYTASALSFLLEDLNKPVILTGSQLPIGVIRTDGKENLITAIEIAADKKEGMPLIPAVAIYFEYMLYKGNRTTKYNAEYFDAFQSPNYPILAEAGIRINYDHTAIPNSNLLPLKTHVQLDENIVILKLFPGINRSAVDAILNIKGLKGVILETYGSGNAPTESWFVKCLKKTIDKGIIIFNVTQCLAGKVDQGRYETSGWLQEIGVISGADITTEAAVTKLMFLLGQDLSTEEIKKQLAQPLRGEMMDLEA